MVAETVSDSGVKDKEVCNETIEGDEVSSSEEEEDSEYDSAGLHSDYDNE